MPAPRFLYYITDRSAFSGDEPTRRLRLLEKLAEAARAGVDYIQLREKDLPTRDLESLAREAISLITQLKTENPRLKTTPLINSRTDVALAVGADGVHLRSNDVSPEDVRKVWTESRACLPERRPSPGRPLIGVSCRTPEEVILAAANGANFAVFGPVFEKKDGSATGLGDLQQACRAEIPVLALGGITLRNAQSCLDAGAAGIAAIRLFQENDVEKIVRSLAG